MMATAKALRPTSVPMVGDTLSSGASSRPAAPASAEDSAYAVATARGTWMPMSAAASISQATALSWRP
jgi:hypothetical protein